MVQWPGGLLLIDCGFSLKELELRLAGIGLAAADLTAALVTHEHADHIKGIGPLARRYKLPVYMTHGTFRGYSKLGDIPNLNFIDCQHSFELDGLAVTPVAVPHDAREPSQFVFSFNQKKLGVLTDLGSISAHVENHYSDCDALVLEANHCPTLLAYGPYPPSLKQRVGGLWGHLSNQQAAGFLSRIDREKLQQLVVAHISEKNNSLDVARQALSDVVSGIETVRFACQDEGFSWLDIGS